MSDPGDIMTDHSERQYGWIDGIGQRAVTEQGIVGLSIAVARNGELVFTGAYGHADADERRPVESNTAFDIASAGKQFTAAAILKLNEEGKLRLDQKTREFVPELPDHFPDATIEQLLRHLSGFVDAELDEFNPPEDYRRKRYGLELLTDFALQNGQAEFRPGETFVYSNAGYLVLGLIVERASGIRYDRYVRQNLLDPLGLDDVAVADRVSPERMSQALHRDENGVVELPYIDMTAFSGQGSICASPADLLTWSRGLNSGQVISAASLAMMRSPSRVAGDESTALVPYAMAQRLGALYGHRRTGHTGTFEGGSAVLHYYPDDGLEIAVLSNTRGNGTPHAHQVETEIAVKILGLSPPDFASLRKPIGENEKRAISGDYSRGFSASFNDAGALMVSRNGELIEQGLVHVGNLRFRNPEQPLIEEYFLMDGESAGWWVYSVSGAYVEVERRVGD